MKDLNYWKNNCEEDYLKTPISVLKYITELEKNNEAKQLTLTDVVSTLKDKDVLTFEEWVKHNYRAGKHNYYSLNGMNCLSYDEVLQKYSVYKQNL
jgi:hypothetical protein